MLDNRRRIGENAVPSQTYTIAMIGAGPAALYSSAKLADAGHNIVIINRDIKPGGLAEFGIYPNKYKMKNGLREFFRKILSHPRVSYLGNVSVGQDADISLDEVRQMGFDAIVVAVGAQGTKWLGLEGEDAEAVFHAKDLVYHYNALPPFSEQEFAIGQHVCVIGLGNVSLDIVHWLACEKKVESVTAVARRGPAERKTTRKELRLVSGALDVEQLRAEFDRIAPTMAAVGQEPDKVFAELTRFVDTPLEVESETKFRMRFFRTPSRIERGAGGEVSGLVCKKTRLIAAKTARRALRRLTKKRRFPAIRWSLPSAIVLSRRWACRWIRAGRGATRPPLSRGRPTPSARAIWSPTTKRTSRCGEPS